MRVLSPKSGAQGAVVLGRPGAAALRSPMPLPNERPAERADPADTVLPDLWRRRGQLSPQEMVRLYQMVRDALARYRPPELQALGEDRDELVAQFIHLKVLRFENAPCEQPDIAAHSAPSSAYAICAYFRRYLIDCLRSASHQKNISLEIEGVARQVDERVGCVSEPVSAALADYNLTEAGVLAQARAFLQTLEPPDRLLLAGGLGHLADDKGGLSQVAARHRIASYHYRAGKLGIVLKKGAVPAAFAQTRIGVWIGQTLGIAIQSDNRQAIQVVLGLLAVAACEAGA